MLFSRYEFVDFPEGLFPQPEEVIGVASSNQVAFVEWRVSDGKDCLANKGAAMVRIKKPDNERVYNIVFLHPDADHDPEDPSTSRSTSIRREQLNQVEGLIVDSIGLEGLNNEDVFVLGDFNTNGDFLGDRRQWDLLLGASGLGVGECDVRFHDPWECENQSEAPILNPRYWRDPRNWSSYSPYQTVESVFPGVPSLLTTNDPTQLRDDVISALTSGDREAMLKLAVKLDKRDRGLTSDRDLPFEEGQQLRVDYILRNNPTGQQGLCFQHMTLAYMQDGNQILSDHFGLKADINQHAEYCNPREARVVSDTEFNMPLRGTITYPSSMQWYLVDQSGTFSFSLNGEGVDYEVYLSNNLSLPLPQYQNLTTAFTDLDGRQRESRTFEFPDGPFYIRVFGSDRTVTGDYSLVIHRHTCQTREDACILDPNRPKRDLPVPSLTLGTSEPMTWFRVFTEGPDINGPQNLDFFVENEVVPNAFSIELLRERSDGTIETIGSTNISNPSSRDKYRTSIPRSNELDNWSTIFLAVRLNALPDLPERYTVGWTTNLTILFSSDALHMPSLRPLVDIGLTCDEQTDFVGDDTIVMRVWVDGMALDIDSSPVIVEPSDRRLDPCGNCLGDFDTGQVKNFSWGPIRYTNEVVLEIWETANGCRYSPSDRVYYNYARRSIAILPESEEYPIPQSTFFNFRGDGYYTFSFNLRHGLQALPRSVAGPGWWEGLLSSTSCAP